MMSIIYTIGTCHSEFGGPYYTHFLASGNKFLDFF